MGNNSGAGEWRQSAAHRKDAGATRKELGEKIEGVAEEDYLSPELASLLKSDSLVPCPWARSGRYCHVLGWGYTST